MSLTLLWTACFALTEVSSNPFAPEEQSDRSRRTTEGAASNGSASPLEEKLSEIFKPEDEWERIVAMEAFFATVPWEEQKTLARHLDKMPLRDRRWFAILLGRRMAMTDAPKALEFVSTMYPADRNPHQLLEAVFAKHAALKPAEAAAWLKQFPKGETWDRLFTALSKVDPALAMSLSGYAGNDAVGMAQSRLVSNDPRSTVEAMLKQPWVIRHEHELIGAVLKWAEKEPLVALEFVRKLDHLERRVELTGAVLTKWAATDPKAVLAWPDRPLNTFQDSTLAALEALARFEPEAAFAQSLDSFSTHRSERVLSIWLKSNPSGAKAAVLKVAQGTVRNSLIIYLVEQLADTDLASALELAALFPAGSWRSRAAYEIADEADKMDRESADKVYSMASLELREKIAHWLAKAIAAVSMRASLEWAESLPPGPPQKAAMDTALRLIGKNKPEVVLNPLLTTGNPKDEYLLRWIFGDWMSRSPNAALKWMEENSNGKNKEVLASAAVKRLSGQDLPRALEIFDRELSPENQRDCLPSLVAGWASSNPSSAATWALGQRHEEVQVAAVGLVAREWAKSNPKQASVWAARLLDSPGKMEALSAVAVMWIEQHSPEEAMAWLEGLPAGPNRDDVKAKVANGLRGSQRSFALILASGLPKEGPHGKLTMEIARDWLSRDARSAKAWISQSKELDPETKRKLLEMKNP